MQNTIRALGGKYANFQVFATPGNHDLYNTSGALYSKENGSKRVSDALCTMQFALVFAGLGYPDANIGGEGGAIDLTDYLPENYWFGKYTTTYIPSTNAKHSIFTTTTSISKRLRPRLKAQVQPRNSTSIIKSATTKTLFLFPQNQRRRLDGLRYHGH